MDKMSERVKLGTAPLGYQPPDRETDGGMSLAPKGFKAAVIRARETHPLPSGDPLPSARELKLMNQAMRAVPGSPRQMHIREQLRQEQAKREAEPERFIIVVHRGDGMYRALDAIGAKFYLRQSAAQRVADKLNSDPGSIAANPSGYVVRSLVSWQGTRVEGNRIYAL